MKAMNSHYVVVFWYHRTIKAALVMAALFGSLLLMSFSNLSCVSSSGTVVARSAAERPQWVEDEVVPEPPESAYLVFKKSGAYRLELGLKQAQASALAEAKALLIARIRKELLEAGKKLFSSTPSSLVAAIDTALAASRNKVETPHVVPVQTYHEEVDQDTLDGSRTHFDIYVLLTVSKEIFGEALMTVSRELANSSDEKGKQLGEAVVASLKQD